MVDLSLQPLLARFEAAVLADPSVLGVLYTGSLGRGTADRFSDLDLEVWLADEAVADLPATTRRLLAVLGTIKLIEARDPWFTQANVGPDWRRVDLHLHRRDDTEPRHDFAGARIVKDVEGALARLVTASVPEDVAPSWDEAEATIRGAIGEQLYIAANNARGATWEAMGAVAHRIPPLYELLARIRGQRSTATAPSRRCSRPPRRSSCARPGRSLQSAQRSAGPPARSGHGRARLAGGGREVGAIAGRHGRRDGPAGSDRRAVRRTRPLSDVRAPPLIRPTGPGAA